MEEIGVFWL